MEASEYEYLLDRNLSDEDRQIQIDNIRKLKEDKEKRKNIQYKKKDVVLKADQKGKYGLNLKLDLKKDNLYVEENKVISIKEIDIDDYCQEITTSKLMSNILKDIITKLDKLKVEEPYNTGTKIFFFYYYGNKYSDQNYLDKVIRVLKKNF
jgi:hypothetical protein